MAIVAADASARTVRPTTSRAGTVLFARLHSDERHRLWNTQRFGPIPLGWRAESDGRWVEIARVGIGWRSPVTEQHGQLHCDVMSRERVEAHETPTQRDRERERRDATAHFSVPDLIG